MQLGQRMPMVCTDFRYSAQFRKWHIIPASQSAELRLEHFSVLSDCRHRAGLLPVNNVNQREKETPE
eukprot:1161603-Pelagomonas_calceolata.AAC.3